MTAEELYSIINAEIEEKAKHDSRISLLKRRIENGSASLAEAVEYNQLVNEIMAKSLSGKVLGTDEREELCKMLLKDSYDKSNEALSTAQRGVDAKTGLNIQPKKASFPAERVDTVAKSLTDTTVEDSVIQRRAENAVENVANSFSVDYIKENAKFRTDAGIKCYLERTTNNKDCCKWCTKMAGRYEYATAPDEVFAYHDKCKCILTYVYGRTSKVVWDGNKKINPKKKKNKKPRVISKDEAKKLESENITFRGLNSEKSVDKSVESGIIESEGKKAILDAFKNSTTSDEVINAIIENHKSLSEFTPLSMKKSLEELGYDVKPLGGKSSLKNIPFEEGGGYRTAFLKDGYFQYHPDNKSHHQGAYWRASCGKKGDNRYDMEGNPIK